MAQTPAFTAHVQVRVSTELQREMVAEAARVGVYVSEWARDAVLVACDRKAVPAKAPQLSGGKKLSIRFRSADYKTVSTAQRASGLEPSDFFRACFAWILKERIDVAGAWRLPVTVNGKTTHVTIFDSPGGVAKKRKRA
jgi:hypothetical protein